MPPETMSQKSRHNLEWRTMLDSKTQSTAICYITQADGSVTQVEVGSRALGQEVIDKVCKSLGIQDESYYFGLQYTGVKHHNLWVNARNRISRQYNVRGAANSPYHLYFKVKYYVPPEDLLLEGTRYQFYINVVDQLKQGIWDSDTTVDTQAKSIALMTFVQFGKYNPNTTPCKYACFWPDSRGEISSEVVCKAASHHRTLDDWTLPQAQYDLLRTVYNDVPSYGTWFYDVEDSRLRRLRIGVGPSGVLLCNLNNQIYEKLSYCRFRDITIRTTVVDLNMMEDNGTSKWQNYRLSTSQLANALYRSATEAKIFFQDDTVREQFMTRTKTSFPYVRGFHYHNCKDYDFDVKYTYREVCDRVRRQLHRSKVNTIPQDSPLKTVGVCSVGDVTSTAERSGSIRSNKKGSHERERLNSHEVYQAMKDFLAEVSICRICMVHPVSIVLIPCGHIITCPDCANLLNECPICRKPIDIRQPCFLPWNDDVELQKHVQAEMRRVRRQSTRSEACVSDSITPSFTLKQTASAPTSQLFTLHSTACLEQPTTSGPMVVEEEINPASRPLPSDELMEIGDTPNPENAPSSYHEHSAFVYQNSESLPDSVDSEHSQYNNPCHRPSNVSWGLSDD